MNINKYIAQNKFLLVLSALLFYFITRTFMIDETSQYLASVLFSIVVVTSLAVIGHTRRPFVLIIVMMALLALLTDWSTDVMPLKSLMLLQYIIALMFFLSITLIALYLTLTDTRVTAGTLYGAISSYLLAGLTWSYVFLIIHQVDPRAFLPINGSGSVGSITDQFIYYSFVTLSTLGYGDIVPLSIPAKTFSWLEAVTGQVYLTVLIAQLVGLYIYHRGLLDELKVNESEVPTHD